VTLVGQRVFGIALGYEDLNDHDELRHDPVMAVLAGKLEAQRKECAPVAGKSTLNRLELSRLEPTRYHKISHNPVAIKRLLVDLFLEAHEQAPNEIILNLDATDDPVHGEQEGQFFHGYYDCYCYCYLPLYIFCGRDLLAAKLRSASLDAAAGAVEEVARIVAHIHRRWPHVRILVRADSGFARDDLMAWCEANGVHFLFGLAKNDRLIAEIESELAQAEAKSRRTGKPARYFKDFRWTTRRSWSRERRVVAKAEFTKGEANPRFVVTSLKRAQTPLREDILRPRRYGEPHQGVPARSLCRPRLRRCEPTSSAFGSLRWPTCDGIELSCSRYLRLRCRPSHSRRDRARLARLTRGAATRNKRGITQGPTETTSSLPPQPRKSLQLLSPSQAPRDSAPAQKAQIAQQNEPIMRR
jgi:Transposase DDE domain group 1